jgi:hypothetical protein
MSKRLKQKEGNNKKYTILPEGPASPTRVDFIIPIKQRNGRSIMRVEDAFDAASVSLTPKTAEQAIKILKLFVRAEAMDAKRHAWLKNLDKKNKITEPINDALDRLKTAKTKEDMYNASMDLLDLSRNKESYINVVSSVSIRAKIDPKLREKLVDSGFVDQFEYLFKVKILN